MSNTALIDHVRIKGFRSLADVELSGIPKATALIGANGSGKSNFIRFFDMLSWMLGSRQLAEFVERQGGADDQLFGGNRRTSRIEAEVRLRTEAGCNDYRFTLAHAHPDRFIFTDEEFRFSRKEFSTERDWYSLGSTHLEAKIVEEAQANTTARVIVNLLRNCAVYQFHDTSDESDFKKTQDAENNNYLRRHGSNIAAVLLRLQREDIKRYELICQHISRILPVFERFQLEESYRKVSLRWKAKGTDKTFGAHLTSDGSLRFFALVTLLNLPPEMLPDVLLLDEPELGLHPAAVTLIGGMIKALAEERQVIVATQSPLLVDAFGLDEIFVLDLHDGRTEFRKLAPDDYREWLDDNFTPGELWQKNLIGGRP
ncbi:MAG: AAA family ATPase [Nitrospira sp.]|nr:AAA family ATPase [Nitrospira sp.]